MRLLYPKAAIVQVAEFAGGGGQLSIKIQDMNIKNIFAQTTWHLLTVRGDEGAPGGSCMVRRERENGFSFETTVAGHKIH